MGVSITDSRPFDDVFYIEYSYERSFLFRRPFSEIGVKVKDLEWIYMNQPFLLSEDPTIDVPLDPLYQKLKGLNIMFLRLNFL